MEKYQLEKITCYQKRNGKMLFKWGKVGHEHYPVTQIGHNYYIFKGSVKIQKYDEIDTLDKSLSIDVIAGESIYLPKGGYYFWFGEEGAEYLTMTDEIPQEYVDTFKIENIDID